MGENLEDIGKRLDLNGDDIRSIRRRRIKDMVILAIVGAVTSFFSFVVGFSNGNTEKYGMAYYPYAVVPLVAGKNYKGRWAVMGIGVVLMIIAGIFMYLRGFEEGKIFYSNSIEYGVYSSSE